MRDRSLLMSSLTILVIVLLAAFSAHAEDDDWTARAEHHSRDWWSDDAQRARTPREKLEDALMGIIQRSANELDEEATEQETSTAILQALYDCDDAEKDATDAFLQDKQPDSKDCRFLASLLCNTYQELCIEWINNGELQADGYDAEKLKPTRSSHRKSTEASLRRLVSGTKLDDSLALLDSYDNYTKDTLPELDSDTSFHSVFVSHYSSRSTSSHSDVRPPDGAPYDVYVHGYTRKDGTYVRPHYRRHPRH